MSPRCFTLNWLRGVLLCFALAVIPGAWAFEDRVEVKNRNLGSVRPFSASGKNWYELNVALDVRPSAGRLSRTTNRLSVVVYLGYDRAMEGGKRRWEFYRSRVELMGLQRGGTQVRFYLPPEIVRRDELEGTLDYWVVRIEGTELAETPFMTRHSAALSDDEVRRDFLEKVDAEAPLNDGILRPQYLTPFNLAYPRSTPTVVLPESWR